MTMMSMKCIARSGKSSDNYHQVFSVPQLIVLPRCSLTLQFLPGFQHQATVSNENTWMNPLYTTCPAADRIRYTYLDTS